MVCCDIFILKKWMLDPATLQLYCLLINCSAPVHIHSRSYCHCLVQRYSNKWGLPSMTTVVFTFSPICHLLRSCMWQKQHGSMWHSVAEPGTALRATDFCSRVCAHRLARSVVESCPLLHITACARVLANFIICTHTHTRVTQEIKNRPRSECILQRVEHIRSLRRYEQVEHILGSHTASPPQTCSLTSITFHLGCCSRPLHTSVGLSCMKLSSRFQ